MGLGDEASIKNKERNATLTRKRELDDLRGVLGTRSGRRFVWRYISMCGVFKTSFTGNASTYFNEGQRDIGLKLLADLMEAGSDYFSTMQKEEKSEEIENG